LTLSRRRGAAKGESVHSRADYFAHDLRRSETEKSATLVTSNLPFDEWTSVFDSERLTCALLNRLTHHVHILEMNGESFRLATSKNAQRRPAQGRNASAKTTTQADTATKT